MHRLSQLKFTLVLRKHEGDRQDGVLLQFMGFFTTMYSHEDINFARGSKNHGGLLNIDPQMHIQSGKRDLRMKHNSFLRKNTHRDEFLDEELLSHGKLFLFEIMTGRQMIVIQT